MGLGLSLRSATNSCRSPTGPLVQTPREGVTGGTGPGTGGPDGPGPITHPGGLGRFPCFETLPLRGLPRSGRSTGWGVRVGPGVRGVRPRGSSGHPFVGGGTGSWTSTTVSTGTTRPTRVSSPTSYGSSPRGSSTSTPGSDSSSGSRSSQDPSQGPSSVGRFPRTSSRRREGHNRKTSGDGLYWTFFHSHRLGSRRGSSAG